MESESRPLTYGEKAVGITFNPGQRKDVSTIKAKFAAIIDELNDRRAKDISDETERLISIAITEAQTAQMWAVKALTWDY